MKLERPLPVPSCPGRLQWPGPSATFPKIQVSHNWAPSQASGSQAPSLSLSSLLGSQEISVLSVGNGWEAWRAVGGCWDRGAYPGPQETLSLYQQARSGQARSSRSCHSVLMPPGPSLPALCPSAPPTLALVLILLDILADSHAFLKTAVLNFLVSRGILRASPLFLWFWELFILSLQLFCKSKILPK